MEAASLAEFIALFFSPVSKLNKRVQENKSQVFIFPIQLTSLKSMLPAHLVEIDDKPAQSF
jgi:hypothetical protein